MDVTSISSIVHRYLDNPVELARSGANLIEGRDDHQDQNWVSYQSNNSESMRSS